MYKLYVRDRALNRIAEIDDYKKLDMTLRFNSPGTWMMDINASLDVASLLMSSGAGIVVVKDGTTLLSGPVLNLSRSWNKDDNILTVSGQDDLYWMACRLAYPVPNGQYGTAEADVRTGKAETIMRQYVDVNAGLGALSQRRITGLILAADQARGSTITGRARFTPLLELLQSLALAGGDLGFKIVQNGVNLEFQVYAPTDKTKTVIFSPALGNLWAYEYSTEAPEANYILCGGSGEGIARVIKEKGDSQSITDYWRIESFNDRRDTADTTELNQAIDEELSQKKTKSSLSISPINTEAISFLRDYGLGDKVTVVVGQYYKQTRTEKSNVFLSPYQVIPVEVQKLQNSMRVDAVIQDVVREINLTLTPDEGEVIAPVVGTPGTTDALNIFKQIADTRKRLSKIERR